MVVSSTAPGLSAGCVEGAVPSNDGGIKESIGSLPKGGDSGSGIESGGKAGVAADGAELVCG